MVGQYSLRGRENSCPYTGGGGGMSPWCVVAVCSWWRLLEEEARTQAGLRLTEEWCSPPVKENVGRGRKP